MAMEELTRLNNRALAVNVLAIDAGQVRIYMEFLNNQIDAILLGTAQPPNWQARYQLESYIRGLVRSEASLRAQGAAISPSGAEVIQAQLLQPSQFTAVASLATSRILAPIHEDAFEFLFTRSYEKLAGWTSSMSSEVRQVMMDAVAQGQGIVATRRQIMDRIGVSRSRAELIARTETIQAFQHAATNEVKRAEEFLGEDIGMRWITARDGRVRHLHANWHGTIVTPQENSLRITRSPWNCRCAQIPVIAEANTPAKTKRFKEERERLLMLERN